MTMVFVTAITTMIATTAMTTTTIIFIKKYIFTRVTMTIKLMKATKATIYIGSTLATQN